MKLIIFSFLNGFYRIVFFTNFVPVKSHGSCAAYETTPLTITEPDSGGNSPRIAWNKLDFPAPTVPITAEIYESTLYVFT